MRALLHDHPRGLAARAAGRDHGQGRRDLRARHGRAREDRRPREGPHPPLGPARGRGHRDPVHGDAPRREALRGARGRTKPRGREDDLALTRRSSSAASGRPSPAVAQRDRWRRLPRFASLRAPAGPGSRSAVRRQLLHGAARERRAPAPEPALRADAARRHDAAVRRGRRDLQPRLPRLADPLPVRPRADDEDERPRRDQHAGPREAREGPHPPGLDERGLRRPDGASAGRGATGAT
jgi:hypothetical protein